MASPNIELLLNRLIESSDVFVNILTHALSQTIGSRVISTAQLHDRAALVQEWRDDWASVLNEHLGTSERRCPGLAVPIGRNTHLLYRCRGFALCDATEYVGLGNAQHALQQQLSPRWSFLARRLLPIHPPSNVCEIGRTPP